MKVLTSAGSPQEREYPQVSFHPFLWTGRCIRGWAPVQPSLTMKGSPEVEEVLRTLSWKGPGPLMAWSCHTGMAGQHIVTLLMLEFYSTFLSGQSLRHCQHCKGEFCKILEMCGKKETGVQGLTLQCLEKQNPGTHERVRFLELELSLSCATACMA